LPDDASTWWQTGGFEYTVVDVVGYEVVVVDGYVVDVDGYVVVVHHEHMVVDVDG
jgi:hypothetical protein